MAELQLLVDNVVVKSFALDKALISIGRSPNSDIVIDEDAISSDHAKIELIPNDMLDGHIDIFVEDLGSTNGTFVNDKPVQRRRLQNFDYVRIAWTNSKLVIDKNVKIAKTSVMVE